MVDQELSLEREFERTGNLFWVKVKSQHVLEKTTAAATGTKAESEFYSVHSFPVRLPATDRRRRSGQAQLVH
jgi:hypothetical protein